MCDIMVKRGFARVRACVLGDIMTENKRDIEKQKENNTSGRSEEREQEEKKDGAERHRCY